MKKINLRKRLPTAIVLLAIVFVAIQYFSNLGFFIILQVVILAALVEFYNLARRRHHAPRPALGVVLALIIGLSFLLDGLDLGLALLIALLLSGAYFVLAIRRLEDLVVFPSAIALTFFGALFLSFMLNHIYLLRLEHGPYLVYFLLAVIFIGDTGAYFTGKLLGNHKMAPLASPRKTWEGSFGGLVFAGLTGIGVRAVFLPEAAVWKTVVFALGVHIVAQVSDPLESLFKRAAGVKDSSNLLPGHGGMFDRVDSLILAAPFFYYLLKIVGIE
ncbi:MAG: phosphatidate cytidylyltransferase [Candidatus Aminicenantales bacterium]